MTKNLFAAVFGFCLLFVCEPEGFSQFLSGTSLNVSGTATVESLVSGTGTFKLLTSDTICSNVLTVTGEADIQSNSLLFGVSGSNAALTLGYYEDADGANAAISLCATRPSAIWNWQRLTTSGSSTVAMQLDGSNRLLLTGTAAINPPKLVIDPNITTGTTSLLTQQTADSRYVSSSSIVVNSVWDDGGVLCRNYALAGGTAVGAGSFAGSHATASGPYSFAFGGDAIASKYYAVALGEGVTASGQSSFATGILTKASGKFSAAFGGWTKATGEGAFAYGFHAQAFGACSLAGGGSDGMLPTASGANSIAIGCKYNAAWGANSCAIGEGVYTTGSNSYVFGLYSHSGENTSFGFGAYVNAYGDYSNASGYGTSAMAYNQTVIGRYNVIPSTKDAKNWQPSDELFTIGNGTSEASPSNALVVKKNGDTTVNGKLTVSGTGGLVLRGTANVVLINPAGDLSMGSFTCGTAPQ